MDYFDKDKYERARKRLEEIKGFYWHATIYFVVNVLLMLGHLGLYDGDFLGRSLNFGFFLTPFFWGIGLLGHALHVFKDNFTIFRDWEERKLKEFMEQEEEDFKNTTRF